MKEFKLIPLNEVELCVSEKHSKPSHTKNENNVLNVGNDDFNDVIKNLMSDEKTDEHFKIKLLNYISQKMDNKINKFSETSKEDNKSVINSNIFDVVKSSIFAADIPNAYRLFTYFAEKKTFNGTSMELLKFLETKSIWTFINF